MDRSDVIFLVVALSAGLGAGYWGGAEAGKIGFVVCFLSALVGVFVLFTVVRALIPDMNTRARRERELAKKKESVQSGRPD